MEEKQKTSFRKMFWQNLFYQKCIFCNSRLEPKGAYLICPQVIDHKQCFVIKISKAKEYIADETHPANRFLPEHERARIEEVLKHY